jgi:hypothetical protein
MERDEQEVTDMCSGYPDRKPGTVIVVVLTRSVAEVRKVTSRYGTFVISSGRDSLCRAEISQMMLGA